MNTHIEVNHNFLWYHCDVKPKTKIQLEEHLKEYHTVPCNKCDTQLLRNKTDLDDHMQACHYFPCNKCSKICTTGTELTDHMIYHSKSCSHCVHVSSNEADLKEHIANKHNFSCGSCNETFVSNTLLLEHHRTNHTFPCTHCDGNYTSKTGVEKHIKEVHNTPCMTSEENVPTTTELEVQKKQNQATNLEVQKSVPLEVTGSTTEDGFSCPKCVLTFDTEENMKVHKSSVHPDTTTSASPIEQEEYDCIICEKDFECKQSLTKHMNDEHTYDCSSCTNKFIAS